MTVASTRSDGSTDGVATAPVASAADYAARRRELLDQPSTPGAGSHLRRRGLAALTDSWLRQVFNAACDATGASTSQAALVAVGGYGRGELAPGSDLDLVLLHSDRDAVPALAEKIWYPVWDSGVHLDHSVRTFDEARRLASSDLAVLLGLLDARPVAGDAVVVGRLRSSVLGDWRAAARRRLPELREAWEERGRRAGDLRHDLEPDLKEGRGGLRDLVSLRAVAASWVADRPHRDVDAAVRRLADVRDALQLSTGKTTNVLVLQEQDRVAEMLGLDDADALLREVGASAAAVTHAADVTWRRALQATRPQRSRFVRGRKPVLRLLGPGLAEHDGEAVLTAQADPRSDPVLVLRMAARAARAGLPLSTSSVDRIVADSEPLPEPWPETARHLFVDMLGAGPSLVQVWEALDQAGLVARLMPEWDLVRHRPQRNAVHRFSVDRHLLETAVCAAPLVREVARPDLLLVAALLHDIGKGSETEGRDHSTVGEPLARQVATRMGFDADDTETLARLVRQHLLLVDTATRRDLDDPITVTGAADVVGDGRTLELLCGTDDGRRARHRARGMERVEGGARGRSRTPGGVAPRRGSATAASTADARPGPLDRHREADRAGRAGRGSDLVDHGRRAGPYRAVLGDRRGPGAQPALGAVGPGPYRGRHGPRRLDRGARRRARPARRGPPPGHRPRAGGRPRPDATAHRPRRQPAATAHRTSGAAGRPHRVGIGDGDGGRGTGR